MGEWWYTSRILDLMEVSAQSNPLVDLSLAKHPSYLLNRRRMVPTAAVNAKGRRKISCPYPQSNHSSSL
jgi:hypothetical protein